MKKTLTVLFLTASLLLNGLPVHAASPEQEISQSDVLVVDASKVTEDTGKTLAEVLGIAQTRAISMPTQVWDWSNGNYEASFSIQYELCYTRYKFTGYSTLYVDTIASRDKETSASDVYTLYVMTGSGSGKIVTSQEINSTAWTYMEISNLKPGEQYAFAIGKANDNSVLSGTIRVKQP